MINQEELIKEIIKSYKESYYKNLMKGFEELFKEYGELKKTLVEKMFVFYTSLNESLLIKDIELKVLESNLRINLNKFDAEKQLIFYEPYSNAPKLINCEKEQIKEIILGEYSKKILYVKDYEYNYFVNNLGIQYFILRNEIERFNLEFNSNLSVSSIAEQRKLFELAKEEKKRALNILSNQKDKLISFCNEMENEYKINLVDIKRFFKEDRYAKNDCSSLFRGNFKQTLLTERIFLLFNIKLDNDFVVNEQDIDFLFDLASDLPYMFKDKNLKDNFTVKNTFLYLVTMLFKLSRIYHKNQNDLKTEQELLVKILKILQVSIDIEMLDIRSSQQLGNGCAFTDTNYLLLLAEMREEALSIPISPILKEEISLARRKLYSITSENIKSYCIQKQEHTYAQIMWENINLINCPNLHFFVFKENKYIKHVS